MASSSSHSLWNYDVFLSFRGSDTRQTFVSHLYKALSNRGIITFKDDRELEKGDSITEEICRAIKSSRFAVVVISKNYASSRWCLDELQLIMELQFGGELIVFAIYYGVEPSDVRHQKGCFAESFQKHETRENPEKVSNWRKAFNRFADLLGVESTTCVDEATMIDEIIEDISCRLPSMQPLDFSNIIGMNDQMARISHLLDIDSDEVRMIGIWGMGGIGKTTIATYLYEHHKHSFAPHYCFMPNVAKETTDSGLLYLQEQLLSNIFRQKNMKLETIEEGRQQFELRLRHLKVFLVLDDVDNMSQVDALAKNISWFGKGSRIIITSRDRGLLKACRVDNVHKVNCLSDVDSLEMFKKIAFENGRPPSYDYNQLSVRASKLVQGLPYAIVAVASYLREKTTIEEWVSSLRRLERYPPSNIMKILKLGYNGLEEQDKNIFLHIVFLFNGYTVKRVIALLQDFVIALLQDFESETMLGLTILADRSLINVSTDGCISMHVLVEQMGIQVVHLSEREPWKRRFLKDPREIYNVLSREKDQGTGNIECMTLHMCEMPRSMTIETNVFKSMHSLQFLKFYSHVKYRGLTLGKHNDFILPENLRLLHWDSYPLITLNFERCYTIRSLVEISLRHSQLLDLPLLTDCINLRKLDLSGSSVRELPDLSNATKLEELILNGYMMLPKLPCGLRKLIVGYPELEGTTKITDLQDGNLNRCRQIRLTLPNANKSLNYLTDLSIKVNDIIIELLGLNGHSTVFSFTSNPQIDDQLMTTSHKTATSQVIPEAHGFRSLKIMGGSLRCSTFSKFIGLIELSLISLKISIIPDDIGELQSLQKLDLSENEFVSLPTTMRKQVKLKYVSLRECNALKALPQLAQVERLTLSNCRNLHSLLEEVPGIEKDPVSYSVLELCLENCKNAKSLSYELSRFTSLRYLDLSNHDFMTLPTSIKELSSLVTLYLENCNKLISIEVLPLSLKYLFAHGCHHLVNVSLPSNHSIKHLDFGDCFELCQNEQVITQFLNNQHSEVVTLRFACMPATQVPSFYNEQSSGTSLPLIRLSRTFIGFDACVMIASRIHLQFSTFSYTWNWKTNEEFRLILKPDIIHWYEEYTTSKLQLVIIHFQSSQVIHNLQFEASLQLSEQYVSKAEITSCGIRVI